jgi:putative transcriptional regulator
MNAMMRVRLKADGRIVEILADGTERAITSASAAGAAGMGQTSIGQTSLGQASLGQDGAAPARSGGQGRDAAYAKGIRARAKLTQAEFAARIGVPIETVRNWEQGKRSPRGPARALLKVIDQAPQVAFAVLDTAKKSSL